MICDRAMNYHMKFGTRHLWRPCSTAENSPANSWLNGPEIVSLRRPVEHSYSKISFRPMEEIMERERDYAESARICNHSTTHSNEKCFLEWRWHELGKCKWEKKIRIFSRTGNVLFGRAFLSSRCFAATPLCHNLLYVICLRSFCLFIVFLHSHFDYPVFSNCFETLDKSTKLVSFIHNMAFLAHYSARPSRDHNQVRHPRISSYSKPLQFHSGDQCEVQLGLGDRNTVILAFLEQTQFCSHIQVPEQALHAAVLAGRHTKSAFERKLLTLDILVGRKVFFLALLVTSMPR